MSVSYVYLIVLFYITFCFSRITLPRKTQFPHKHSAIKFVLHCTEAPAELI